jgi:hypothetical protein
MKRGKRRRKGGWEESGRKSLKGDTEKGGGERTRERMKETRRWLDKCTTQSTSKSSLRHGWREDEDTGSDTEFVHGPSKVK